MGSRSRTKSSRRRQSGRRDHDEEMDSHSERYRVAKSASSVSYSSHGDASDTTSEASRSEGLTPESSFVSDSEDESTESGSHLQRADTEEFLDMDVVEATSYDSKQLGSWFDSACNWLDRPTACAILMGSSHEKSLLRESKMKSIPAIRHNKFHEASSIVTTKEEKRSIRLERKGLVDSEKSSLESTKEDQSEKDSSERPENKKGGAKDEENKSSSEELKPAKHAESADKSEQGSEKQATTKGERGGQDLPNDINAALRRTIEARNSHQLRNLRDLKKRKASKKRGQGTKIPESPNPASVVPSLIQPQQEYRQTVKSELEEIPKVAERPAVRDVAEPTESIPPEHPELQLEEQPETQPDSPKSPEPGLNMPDKKEKSSLSPRPVKHEERHKPAGSSTPPTVQRETEEDLHQTENIEEGLHQTEDLPMAESEEILSTSGDENRESGQAEPKTMPVPIESPVVPEEETRDVMRGTSPVAHATAEITDLTHIEEAPVEALRTVPSLKASRSGSHVKRKKSGNRNQVDVIDVFELDDEDSWTPGETREPTPTKSRHSVHSPASDRMRESTPARHRSPGRDKSPSRSRRMARVGNSQNGEDDQHHTMKVEKKHDTTPDESFKDPEARAKFAGLRRGRLEVPDKAQEQRSRSKSRSRHERSATSNSPEDVSRHSRRSVSRDKRQDSEEIQSPSKKLEARKQIERDMELRKRAMGVVEHQSNNQEGNSRRSGRSMNRTALGSPENAESRRRRSKSREAREMNLYSSRTGDSEVFEYGTRTTSNREAPIDVHNYLAPSRSREQNDRSRAPLRPEMTRVEGSQERTRGRHGGRDPAGPEDREGRNQRLTSHRDRELYGTMVVNHSKSRENLEITDLSDLPDDYGRRRSSNRGRAMEGRDDDFESRYYGQRDPAGHFPVEPYEKAVRREKSPHLRKANDDVKDLKRLEKKISRQLKQDQQDRSRQKQDHSDRSVSSKHLRKLEKRLESSLKREDEKRAAKLKRLRSKHSSRKPGMGLDGSTPDRVRPESKLNDNTLPEKGTDVRDASKYAHLKVLRQSRPMHKYMHQRSSSRTPGTTSTGPEAY